MSSRMDDDERGTAPQKPMAEKRTLTDDVRLGGGIGIVLALVLFFAQNFDDAKISFLWFDWTMPLVFALLISAAFGGLSTWLFSTLRGRAERKRQEAVFESAMRGAKK
jgi:uncharacterized integral membrane protein